MAFAARSTSSFDFVTSLIVLPARFSVDHTIHLSAVARRRPFPKVASSKIGPCTEAYAVCVNRPSAICGCTGSAANPNNLICGWTITGSSLECFKNFTETPVNGSTFPTLASPAGTATSTPSKSASAGKAGSVSLFFSNSVTVALLLVVMTAGGGLVL
ncbi:hypothetical protein BJ742DRAFT_855534 [Cladochytrium replicatum]|nr:hypothetical protein BJ742DRAFT_855534 [Cladochytrium replicatum]